MAAHGWPALIAGPARRVRRLRLRAPDEGSARRGAFLLEDALHTASLWGAAGGRLVLVRRLALGPIDPRAASATVAALVEERFRALLPGARHGGQPGAEACDLVWFEDLTEGLASVLDHLRATGGPPGWVARALVPALASAPGRGAAVRAVLARALEDPSGPAALVALLARAGESGSLDLVLTAIDDADAGELLAACGWGSGPVAAANAPQVAAANAVAAAAETVGGGGHALTGVPARFGEIMARLVPGTLGAGSARTRLLAVVALAAGRLDRVGAPEIAREADRIVALLAVVPGEQILARPAARDESPASGAEQTVDERDADRPVIDDEPRAPAPVGATASVEQPTDVDLRSSPAGAQRPRDAAGHRAHDNSSEDAAALTGWHARMPAAEATDVAGLLFLIPLLQRLGLVDYLDANPAAAERHLPARLLDRAAARACGRPADPLRCWLRALIAGRSEVAVTPLPAALQRDLARFWQRARRQLSGDTGGSLSWLIRRPGLLAATATHVDVFLPPENVDLRVRLAALDVDPGWVPWLGRVVTFHYDDPEGRRQ